MSSTTARRSELAGRTALITGASRGIGRECAIALAQSGARLLLLGRSTETMTVLLRDMKNDGASFAIDLADQDSVAGALANVRSHIHGAPDIVVNNAGQFFVRSIEKTDVADFERTLTVNLASQFAIVREFIADMRKRGSGHIVTIGSIADHQAFAENAAYAASKFGVRAVHEVLRAELRGTGVRATLVSPGPTDTSIWDSIEPDTKPGFTPRARMLAPSAVAEAVRFVVTQPPDVNIDELRIARS
jgi:NADP-dependent 3-hydroxy acid dehydrogenase YdfG